MIESTSLPGVVYHLDRLARDSGIGATYFARRESVDGVSPVVVKVMRSIIGDGRISAEIVAAKEAVALGRLSELVPPNPFVVPMLDSGAAEFEPGKTTPWSVLEYVHGGIEGTTLEERVTYSLHKTGYGFSPNRAAHLLRCVCGALSAVHAVRVVHRDLSPSNVLCCGFGETEIFKISNFGVARAEGIEQTFAGTGVGTLGYSAPEASHPAAGPHSDVFSVACILYYALTGQHYFVAKGPVAFLRELMSESRASLFDHAALHPDLQHDLQAGQEMDSLIAAATSLTVADRPPSVLDFLRKISDFLGDSAPPRSSVQLRDAVTAESAAQQHARLRWSVRSWPNEALALRSVAWDTDGHAFAIAEKGIRFWNGHAWVDASRILTDLPPGLTFARRYDAGGWLVGGQGPVLSVVDSSGVRERVEAPEQASSFVSVCGRLGDLLVAVVKRPEQGFALTTHVAGRWTKPLPLDSASDVTALHQLDADRWLVGGRDLNGVGSLAVYTPLDRELERVALDPGPPLSAGASLPDRGLGVFVGGERVLRKSSGAPETSMIVGSSLHAVAIDVLQREWVAGQGVMYDRADATNAWSVAWSDPTWTSPFCALLADVGMVAGITSDGGIIEGRT